MRIFSIQRVFALLLNIFYHSGGKRNKIVHLKTSAGRIVRRFLPTLRNKKGTFSKRNKIVHLKMVLSDYQSVS